MTTTNENSLPLVVDLDGTLIDGDLFIESLVALLHRNPLVVLWLPWWWTRGRARVKHEVARRVELDVRRLPYRDTVCEFVRQQRAAGRRVVLATAADAQYARKVAAHVGGFEEVIASDGKVNFKGAAKASALVARFGDGGFDYLGDSPADLAVWSRARAALLVEPEPTLLEQARQICRVDKVLRDIGPRGRSNPLKKLLVALTRF